MGAGHLPDLDRLVAAQAVPLIGKARMPRIAVVARTGGRGRGVAIRERGIGTSWQRDGSPARAGARGGRRAGPGRQPAGTAGDGSQRFEIGAARAGAADDLAVYDLLAAQGDTGEEHPDRRVKPEQGADCFLEEGPEPVAPPARGAARGRRCRAGPRGRAPGSRPAAGPPGPASRRSAGLRLVRRPASALASTSSKARLAVGDSTARTASRRRVRRRNRPSPSQASRTARRGRSPGATGGERSRGILSGSARREPVQPP